MTVLFSRAYPRLFFCRWPTPRNYHSRYFTSTLYQQSVSNTSDTLQSVGANNHDDQQKPTDVDDTATNYFTSNDTIKEPLRIALFGTDNFTVFSLDALYNYKLQNPDIIETLDVITRIPKPSGRGMKSIKEAPSAEYALHHDLTVLRAETDSEIIQLLNRGYNLAVAVSYGRLIPAAFLTQLKFGGINVHPSLLPDLSGAAPLHRALLRRYPFTGVTVQTLHPTKFDRGRILIRSPEIPILKNENLESLENRLGNIGANCLIQVIEERRFANQEFFSNAENSYVESSEYKPSYAPKVTPQERNINFEKDSVNDILLRQRILGKLNAFQKVDPSQELKRIVLHGLQDVSHITSSDIINRASLNLGQYDFYTAPNQKKTEPLCIIKAKDGFLSASHLLFEGYGLQTPDQFRKSMKKRGIVSTQLQTNISRKSNPKSKL